MIINAASQEDPFTPPEQIIPEFGGIRYRKNSAKKAFRPTTASPEFVRDRDSTTEDEETEGPATQESDSSSSSVPNADTRCHIEKLPDHVLIRILEFLPTDFPVAGGVYVACILSEQFHKVATQVLYKTFKLSFTLEQGFKPEVKRALRMIPISSAQYIQDFSLVCQPLSPDDEATEKIQKAFSKLAPVVRRVPIKVNWKQVLLTLNSFIFEKLAVVNLSSISIQIDNNDTFQDDHQIIPQIPSFRIKGHNLPSSLLTQILGQMGFPNNKNIGKATSWAALCQEMASVIDEAKGEVAAVNIEMVGSNAILGSLLGFIRHNRKTMQHLQIAFPGHFEQIRNYNLPMLNGYSDDDVHEQPCPSHRDEKSDPEIHLQDFGYNIVMARLKTLEIFNPRRLALARSPWPSILQTKLLQSLSLDGVTDDYFVNQTALVECCHVKKLKLASCPVHQVDAFLNFMPTLLEEVVLVDMVPIAGDDMNRMQHHPTKKAVLRHRDSLRLLVIDIIDHNGDAPSAKPIQPFDDASKEIDIFTINQCRKLEYLKIPLSPEFGTMILLPKLIELAVWQCGPNITGITPEQEELKNEAEQIASNLFELNGEPRGFPLKIVSFQDGNYQNVFETGGEYQGEDEAFNHQAVFWGSYADESAVEVAMFERPETRILLPIQFD